jgi:hypothetical protein
MAGPAGIEPAATGFLPVGKSFTKRWAYRFLFRCSSFLSYGPLVMIGLGLN